MCGGVNDGADVRAVVVMALLTPRLLALPHHHVGG
jgi:hypothetical protein